MVSLSEKLAKLSQNFSNCSEPLLSDIIAPPREITANWLAKKGAEARHAKHERTPFWREQTGSFYEHGLDVWSGRSQYAHFS